MTLWWRASVFAYVKIPEPPYFTYFRGTLWMREEPDFGHIAFIKAMLNEAIEERTDEAIHESIKQEVEQVDAKEVPPKYDGSLYLSESKGRIPAENYFGHRQPGLDEYYDNDLEA